MLQGGRRFLEADEPDPDALREALVSTWQLWWNHQSLMLALLDARGSNPAVREVWDGWIERFVEPVATAVEQIVARARCLRGRICVSSPRS